MQILSYRRHKGQLTWYSTSNSSGMSLISTQASIHVGRFLFKNTQSVSSRKQIKEKNTIQGERERK